MWRTAITAGIGAVIFTLIDVTYTTLVDNVYNKQSDLITALNGTFAKVEEASVLVTHYDGRQFNFLTDPHVSVRSAAFSSDGAKIAMTVISGNRCQIRVFEFETQNMESYKTCAGIGSMRA